MPAGHFDAKTEDEFLELLKKGLPMQSVSRKDVRHELGKPCVRSPWQWQTTTPTNREVTAKEPTTGKTFFDC